MNVYERARASLRIKEEEKQKAKKIEEARLQQKHEYIERRLGDLMEMLLREKLTMRIEDGSLFIRLKGSGGGEAGKAAFHVRYQEQGLPRRWEYKVLCSLHGVNSESFKKQDEAAEHIAQTLITECGL